MQLLPRFTVACEQGMPALRLGKGWVPSCYGQQCRLQIHLQAVESNRVHGGATRWLFNVINVVACHLAWQTYHVVQAGGTYTYPG